MERIDIRLRDQDQDQEGVEQEARTSRTRSQENLSVPPNAERGFQFYNAGEEDEVEDDEVESIDMNLK